MHWRAGAWGSKTAVVPILPGRGNGRRCQASRCHWCGRRQIIDPTARAIILPKPAICLPARHGHLRLNYSRHSAPPRIVSSWSYLGPRSRWLPSSASFRIRVGVYHCGSWRLIVVHSCEPVTPFSRFRGRSHPVSLLFTHTRLPRCPGLPSVLVSRRSTASLSIRACGKRHTEADRESVHPAGFPQAKMARARIT